MEALAGLSLLALVAVSGGVGARLLGLARRTRGLPELALGLALILASTLGYPLLVLARAALRSGHELAFPLYAVATILVDTGFWFLFVFTWSAFRRESSPARGLVLVGATVLGLHALGFLLLRALPGSGLGSTALWGAVQLGAGAAAYLWTAFEALRFYGRMRRRLGLGLADPVVTNRFLLWGVMGLVAASAALVNLGTLQLGADALAHPGVRLATATSGLLQALVLMLTFFPPAAYRRRLRRRVGPVAA